MAMMIMHNDTITAISTFRLVLFWAFVMFDKSAGAGETDMLYCVVVCSFEVAKLSSDSIPCFKVVPSLSGGVVLGR